MEIFIELHRTKVAINTTPIFHSILINIKDIVAVEPTAREGCGSEVFIKNVEPQMRFHPLYCREKYDAVLALLKEKGVEITPL